MKLRLLLLSVWLVLPGCQTIDLPEPTMPRIGFDEEPAPAIPVSVAYAFDASVTEARIETQACGSPYTLNTGEIIPQAFLAVGRKRFESVTAYEGTGEAVRAEQSSDLTIQLGMIHHSFQDIDRMAEEDNYLALLDMQLQATFVDRDGTELAQTPLRFNDQVNIWAPALTGQSVSCATGQYDAAIRSASQDLANQLANMVPALFTSDAPPSPSVANQPTTPTITPAAPQATPPSLTFRTRLKDANENLVLEGGETIVLEIEATYTGTSPLVVAHANLNGSDTIVKAFSDITTLPVSLGAFQPGETKTTEIRGRMPLAVIEPTGELVISLTSAGESAPIGSYRILAPLRAGNPAPPATDAADAAANPPHEDARPAGEAYVAVLVGMDTYRDDWPDAYLAPTGHMEAVGDALQMTGTFTEPNIRMLNGNHAAKSDVEEALFTWGRQRIGAESVLLVYFSGQSVKNPKTGEVYLVPYEGSPDASANRLIALRTLQRALGTFDNRLTLLILDAPLIPLNNPASDPDVNESRPVRWDGGLPAGQGAPPVIQIRNMPGQENSDHAGIFARLLNDTEADHAITVGEFLARASTMIQVTPALPDASPVLGIPLAQNATARTSDESTSTLPASEPPLDSPPPQETGAEFDTNPLPPLPTLEPPVDDPPAQEAGTEFDAKPLPAVPTLENLFNEEQTESGQDTGATNDEQGTRAASDEN